MENLQQTVAPVITQHYPQFLHLNLSLQSINQGLLDFVKLLEREVIQGLIHPQIVLNFLQDFGRDYGWVVYQEFLICRDPSSQQLKLLEIQ